MVEVNNGVSVRGLRVLRTTEYRSTSWWKSVLASVMSAAPEAAEEYWSILTVRDSNGHEVACRRFESIKAAEAARDEFGARVTSLGDSKMDAADLQAVLDLS